MCLISSKIRINSIEVNSVVNGTGLRIVIYFQGCYRRCEGCQNKHTWDFKKGKLVDIEDLMKIIRKHSSVSTGVTISGGEPFLQPEALAELVFRIKANTKLNVWLYTGYKYEEIPTNVYNLKTLNRVDVLVDGEFKKELLDTTSTPRGSTNQRIINLKEIINED